MSGKVIAQMIVQGIAIFGKAAASAYRQALANAKAGGHVGGGGGVKTVSKHKMSALEALKILNIEKPDMTLQIVNQSKIYRAHAALLTELGEDGDDKKEGSSEGSGDKEGQTDSEKKDESK